MTHVAKTKVPQPHEAKTAEDHVMFAEHMIEQIKAGHYTLKNIEVVRQDSGDREARTHERNFTTTFTVVDTVPDAPVGPHNLSSAADQHKRQVPLASSEAPKPGSNANTQAGKPGHVVPGTDTVDSSKLASGEQHTTPVAAQVGHAEPNKPTAGGALSSKDLK